MLRIQSAVAAIAKYAMGIAKMCRFKEVVILLINVGYYTNGTKAVYVIEDEDDGIKVFMNEEECPDKYKDFIGVFQDKKPRWIDPFTAAFVGCLKHLYPGLYGAKCKRPNHLNQECYFNQCPVRMDFQNCPCIKYRDEC